MLKIQADWDKLKKFGRKWFWLANAVGVMFLTYKNFSLQREVRILYEEKEQLKTVLTQTVAMQQMLQRDMVNFNRSYEPFPLPTWQKVKRGDKYVMQYINPAYVRHYGHQFNYDRYSYIGKTDYDIYPKDQAEQYERFDNIVAMSGEAVMMHEFIYDNKDQKHDINVIKWREISAKDTLVYGMIILNDLDPSP